MQTPFSANLDKLTCERIVVDGRAFDLWSNGKLLPVVRGGIDDGGDGGDGGSGDGGDGADGAVGGDGGDGKSPKKESGDDAGAAETERVNKIVQERLRKDREARDKKLAEQLGGKSLEEVLAAAGEHQKKVDADLSDVEKATKEAAEAKAKADAQTASAARAELRADAVTALVLAGADAKRITRSAEILLNDLEKIDSIDDDSIATCVTALKKEMPELFGATKSDDGDGKPDSDINGRGPTGAGGDGKSGVEAGRERARKERAGSNGDSGKPFAGLRTLGSLTDA